MTLKALLMIGAAATTLSACTLAPAYEQPALPVPQMLPAHTLMSNAATPEWRQVFRDPRLQHVIQLALDNNRDLRVAVLNSERVKNQYRIQASGLLPGVSGSVAGQKGENPQQATLSNPDGRYEGYSADIGASWELDLFGRVRSLTGAALETWLGSEETANAARISLVSAVATAWLNLAADEEQLALSRQTLSLREESYGLMQQRFEAGASDATALRQSEILTEQARADVAGLEARVEQDKNALRLLVGTDIPAEFLPSELSDEAILTDIPVGLSSNVLLSRPDVLAAEYDLRAANANIGAARAAFFPRISLTGALGKASGDLDGLFDGADTWSFTPVISVPIFAGGANIAGLNVANTTRDIALARYEQTIQSAFRDVSDALAVRATIDTQLAAQTRVVTAAQDNARLARQRFDAGIDSRLVLTDAERTLYGAQQGLIGVRLARTLNAVSLYATLGGGLR